MEDRRASRRDRKIDQAVQPLGKIVEQVGQIAGGDDLRHVVQQEAMSAGMESGP